MVRRFLSLCLFALALPAVGASAQTVAVAQLSGTILDDSGGAVPGVDVTVTQTATAMTRSVVTSGKGEYVFTNLPVGPYKLTARLQGFATYEQTGITLSVGASPIHGDDGKCCSTELIAIGVCSRHSSLRTGLG